jgi:hypothetical protein
MKEFGIRMDFLKLMSTIHVELTPVVWQDEHRHALTDCRGDPLLAQFLSPSLSCLVAPEKKVFQL